MARPTANSGSANAGAAASRFDGSTDAQMQRKENRWAMGPPCRVAGGLRDAITH